MACALEPPLESSERPPRPFTRPEQALRSSHSSQALPQTAKRQDALCLATVSGCPKDPPPLLPNAHAPALKDDYLPVFTGVESCDS